MFGQDSIQSTRWVNTRRTQRVLVRIPILVRGQPESESAFTEETHTLVVNAHGALIALAMKVRPGQKPFLKNWASGKEQECRVVHVVEKQAGKTEVGIAFPHPAPKFWRIEFPPDDWKPLMD